MIFSGRQVDSREAAAFLLDYYETMLERDTQPRNALARVKGTLRHFTAGGLFDDPAERQRRMSESEPEGLVAWLRSLIGDPESTPERSGAGQ